MKMHLDRWWENRSVFKSVRTKIHQNFLTLLKSGFQRKPGKMLKMSTEGGQQNKFILTSHSSSGVMDKYTKHRLFTALVFEIRASLYSTPSEAIFISKFSQFSETHRTLKIERAKFVFCMRVNTTQKYFLKS